MKNFKFIKILFLLLIMVSFSTQSTKAYSVHKPPVYINGGEKGLLRDLYSNFSRVLPTQSDSIEGRCIFSFFISKEGTIEVETIKLRRVISLPDEYVDAAKEAIKHLGNFEPGEMNGIPKRVSYILPVIYPITIDKIKADE